MNKKAIIGILFAEIILMAVCYATGRLQSAKNQAETPKGPAQAVKAEGKEVQTPEADPADLQAEFSIQEIAESDMDNNLVVELFSEEREGVLWATADWLSYQKTVKGYTGGAHAFYHAEYGTINRKTGKRLHLADIAAPEKMPELTRAIQQALLENFKKCDQFKGTTFEELRKFLLDDVKPTENFYYDDKGLHFSYGEYEIAAFAYSSYCADVRIPWPLPQP